MNIQERNQQLISAKKELESLLKKEKGYHQKDKEKKEHEQKIRMQVIYSAVKKYQDPIKIITKAGEYQHPSYCYTLK